MRRARAGSHRSGVPGCHGARCDVRAFAYAGPGASVHPFSGTGPYSCDQPHSGTGSHARALGFTDAFAVSDACGGPGTT